jgi:predicted ferric reductase
MNVATRRTPPQAPPRRSSHAARRPGPAPVPWFANLLATVGGIGFGASVALALSQESRATLSTTSGQFEAIGRLSGATGTYLMAVMLILIARIPWLERTVGQDRLALWHRRIGGWPIALIALHVITVVYGYSLVTKSGVVAQFLTFILHYPDMLAAAVGFALLIAVGVASFPPVRRRLKYETWWAVHLFIYLALVLAFAHQIKTGIVFLGHPLSTELWVGGAILVLGVTLVSRFIFPVGANLRHRLVVHDVREVAPGVHSLVLAGRRLDRLAVSGGQFFQWRFLSPGLFWHSHPYSLSALPKPPFLRVTVKALGDQSRALARLKPGTRAFIEGPYGTFTHHSRTSQSVTLIGAGVGATPLRALLEDLPAHVVVTVVLRASRPEDLVHRDEIAVLVAARGGVLHEIVGSRHDVAFDARALRRLAPKVRSSDVYICGPQGFSESVQRMVRSLHVPDGRIHVEEFSF